LISGWLSTRRCWDSPSSSDVNTAVMAQAGLIWYGQHL
jgi:hypothetical protein